MPSAARKSARLLSAPKMLVLLAVVLLITSHSEAFSTRSTTSAPTSSKIIQSRTSVPSARRSRNSLVITSTPLYPCSPLTSTAAAATTSGEDENEKRSSTPSDSEASKDVNDNNIDDDAKEFTASSTTSAAAAAGLDRIFNAVDVDGSGALDLEEFERHLAPAGYSRDAIQTFFDETDSDNNGEISRDEFRRAVLGTSSRTASCEEVMNTIDIVDDCPRGYFLNSVKQTCVPLGIIGRISQKVEMMAPFQQTYKGISNLFGVDRKQISKLGVSFALSYSIISNLNGAISFSIAWYMSCKRTGLSPLVQGQWKTLLTSYAMIYGVIQIFRPFRVAMAIGMSKLSAEYLEMTQSKFNCSRGVAIGCQYLMGQIMMAICALIGVSIVTLITGVPLFG